MNEAKQIKKLQRRVTLLEGRLEAIFTILDMSPQNRKMWKQMIDMMITMNLARDNNIDTNQLAGFTEHKKVDGVTK